MNNQIFQKTTIENVGSHAIKECLTRYDGADKYKEKWAAPGFTYINNKALLVRKSTENINLASIKCPKNSEVWIGHYDYKFENLDISHGAFVLDKDNGVVKFVHIIY
ncbi:hypothetical protein [Campylobacter geochelonis]|uniref:hypothetical protein n=1 Tax=Campylobacter geochelonis TaxID=1780362 RepID=UPI000770735A|nr:hypothetical protein [Campylobacter geochelonis]CZE47595.1 Uncharacterised protein [Campylobacter geochelonis]